ncbi:heparan-alpha-glucosaminide N-acetyltransferase-like isoform X2 [Ptychodera flava]
MSHMITAAVTQLSHSSAVVPTIRHNEMASLFEKVVFFTALFNTVTAVDTPALFSLEGTQRTLLTEERLIHDRQEMIFDTPEVIGHSHDFEQKIDTAYLYINSTVKVDLDIFGQTTECYQCALMSLTSIRPAGSTVLRVNTTWPTEIFVQDKSQSQSCNKTYHFGQSGHYVLWIFPVNTENGSHFECNIVEAKSPVDIYIPIYIAIAVYVGVLILYIVWKQIYRKKLLKKIFYCLETDRLVNSDLGSPNNIAPSNSVALESVKKPEKPKSARLKSLDTFRGISIVVMIFANLGGGEYWFFKHSRWNGLTIADLVFPWFVFIMGTSIVLAYNALYKKGATMRGIFFKIIKRTIILFAIGVILGTGKDRNGVDLQSIRIPGVLQRFSICYFVVATVEMLTARIDDPHRYKWFHPIRDFVHLWLHWLVALLLLALYLCLAFLLPVPGCPMGYFGPGGALVFGLNRTSLLNCTGGSAGYIDKYIFGENHIYQHPTCKDLYQTGPYDPEGILGSITSIFITFLGVLAGKVLLVYPDWVSRTKRWILWAIILGSIAAILCDFSQNEGTVPINKNLW